jgi:hypothetical protein
MSALAVGHGLNLGAHVSKLEYNTTWVLGRIAATTTTPSDPVEYSYFRAGNSDAPTNLPVQVADPGLFYGELLRAEQASPFRPGLEGQGSMQVKLNYGPEGQRIVDMAHNAVGDTLATFVGDFPNYGDGAA